MINSKTRELMALQEEAAARLAQTKRSFMEGMKVAKEVKADLDYVHKRVMFVPPRYSCEKGRCFRVEDYWS